MARDEDALASLRQVAPGQWSYVLARLGLRSTRVADDVLVELRRIFSAPPADEAVFDIHLLALVHLVDESATSLARNLLVRAEPRSDWLLREFDIMRAIAPESLLALTRMKMPPSDHNSRWDDIGDDVAPLQVIAADDEYARFSRQVLADAVQHLSAIHAGKTPYVPDGAFTIHDTRSIARAAWVSAWRDDGTWACAVDALMNQSCVAPTRAKTTPSQSLAIQLTHVIRNVPTPESVDALKQAVADVRHAGLRKKLARHVHTAGHRLGFRPELALRLAARAPDETTHLLRCLENGYWLGTGWPATEWQRLLAPIRWARSLVWSSRGADGTQSSFLWTVTASLQQAIGLDRECIDLADDDVVGLWHPLDGSSDERRLWEQTLSQLGLRQPLRQVDGETFEWPPSQRADRVAAMLTDITISPGSVLGRARVDQWQHVEGRGLRRQIGWLRVSLEVPDSALVTSSPVMTCCRLTVEQRAGSRWEAVALSALGARQFSESVRAAVRIIGLNIT